MDTIYAVVIAHTSFNLSLVVWMMRGFFAEIPKEIDEAAMMDGRSRLGAFFFVVAPLAAPGIGATAVLCFILSWNDFFYALILTRTNAMTAPVAIINFMQYEGWEWGKMAAGGTLVMLPVVIFTVLVRKWLVSGLIAGSVKQ